MVGVFKANYISQRSVKSKDGLKTYYYAQFNDGNGDFEVNLDAPLECDRFKEVTMSVDVIQGKYPKFKLVNIK